MNPVFDAYGKYYDLFYRDKNYTAEGEWVLSRLRVHHPALVSLLELGCGTGGHAQVFAKHGLAVHGVDRSESMLQAARHRCELLPDLERGRIRLTSGDVRRLRTGETYDAVIALFHVASYQTTNADIEGFLETAAYHLAPGGVLAFDFWFGPAVLAQQPSVRVQRLSDPTCRITRIAEPTHRFTENVVDVQYTLFVEETATGVISSLQETHSMRYLFVLELEAMAARWFGISEWSTWMSNQIPDQNSWSAFALMVRK